MDIKSRMNQKAEAVNEILQNYLLKEEGLQKTILEAVNYSLLAGGKRLRPMLMKETYEMFGGTGEIIHPFMAAMEMIHTYSLVHDDLPAMDNDEYRRGKKTTHAVYGETMGILAGDALLNLAFETATLAFDIEPANPNIGKALQVLAKKAGVYGMIGGQVVDIESEAMEADRITKERLDYIHHNKTAALVEASMMIGAILAGASAEDVKKIEAVATKVGLAFQIQDDILDVTSSFEELGKPIGSDAKNQKVTYVTFEGLEKSKQDVEELSNEAIALLKGLPKKDDYLESLILYLVSRRN
uniref:polyprenyl synthetase family protein n=1 Tax=Agathobacter sp. TaxID=2021311 RepID=UPI004056244C